MHPDQTGFLKGRYIDKNTRWILDILEYAKKENRFGSVMFVDCEKTFSSIAGILFIKPSMPLIS